MVVTVTHTFVSAIADDPTAASAGQVVPSNWNATHTIGGSVAGAHLYFDNNSALQAAKLQGYLFGLTLSTAGASTTFTVAAGMAADRNAGDFMVLASSLNKTTGAWAVGSGNGGMDTGTAAANGWYHVYLIKRPDTGVVDALFSLSATAPTMPANYTLFRRIGSMKLNGSSQWYAFIQLGDDFLWSGNMGMDQNGVNPGATASLLGFLNTPQGISVKALYRAAYTNSAANQSVYFWSPLQGNVAQAFYDLTNPVASLAASGNMQTITNTSAQIYAVCNTASNNSVYMAAYGWNDTRGKLY